MSNICAGIGRGQMTVADKHIDITDMCRLSIRNCLRMWRVLHEAPSADYDSNFWLCTITLDSSLRIKGQENAYKDVVGTAVGGAAGVIHAVDCATTDCQPNENVEALRAFMLGKK